MKIKTLFLYLFCILLSGRAQDKINYSALLLSFDGEGVLSRNSNEEELKLPRRLVSGDKLTVKKGNAVVMLFSGEEIAMTAVSNYTVPTEKRNASSEISNMVNGSKTGKSLLSQSGLAYQLRGKSKVFPTASKVLNQKNTILKFAYDKISELKLSLKIFDSQTQKVVYQTKSITEEVLSLADVPFVPGKSYHWILSNTPNGKPEMGTLVIAKESEIEKFKAFANPQTHYEFINAISAFYNGKYYFEALNVIKPAIEKYPDYQIYPVLLNNLLTE